MIHCTSHQAPFSPIYSFPPRYTTGCLLIKHARHMAQCQASVLTLPPAYYTLSQISPWLPLLTTTDLCLNIILLIMTASLTPLTKGATPLLTLPLSPSHLFFSQQHILSSVTPYLFFIISLSPTRKWQRFLSFLFCYIPGT